MKTPEKIIDLIDKGDPISILAEASLVENFNELLKYELIDIIDEKIVLTLKGKEARDLGFDKVIEELKFKKEFKEFSVEKQKKENKLCQLCFGLSVSLLIIFLAISFTDCNLVF